MATKPELAFVPDYAIPPGESLAEILESIDMSQAELAKRTGRPLKTINEIVKGKTAITPETAIQLERVLNVPASFWNNRERQYREALARIEENRQLRSCGDWVKRFPLKSMIAFGWIQGFEDAAAQTREVLTFLGLASPAQWDKCQSELKVAFRKSPTFEADSYAVAAWLRQGELVARNIVCREYDPQGFRSALQEARSLTTLPPERFVPQLQELCSKVGVAVVFVRELPKTRASGATEWIAPQKALMVLSVRYRTDDHLWFTFFHEACHILKHSKKERFIEGVGNTDSKEHEANVFSADLLIPPSEYKIFIAAGDFGETAIKRFAKALGIAPGIVVGRLQHDKHIEFSACNGLKQRYRWSEGTDSKS